jgi:hypothetical protein
MLRFSSSSESVRPKGFDDWSDGLFGTDPCLENRLFPKEFPAWLPLLDSSGRRSRLLALLRFPNEDLLVLLRSLALNRLKSSLFISLRRLFRLLLLGFLPKFIRYLMDCLSLSCLYLSICLLISCISLASLLRLALW